MRQRELSGNIVHFILPFTYLFSHLLFWRIFFLFLFFIYFIIVSGSLLFLYFNIDNINWDLVHYLMYLFQLGLALSNESKVFSFLDSLCFVMLE